MPQVYIHYKEEKKDRWTNETREFTRLPCVGEYVTLTATSPLYRVYFVIHCPFKAEVDGEVYLTKEDISMAELVQLQKPSPML